MSKSVKDYKALDEALAQATYYGWAVRDGIDNGRSKKDIYWLVRLAVRAAFRAVPGLRG